MKNTTPTPLIPPAAIACFYLLSSTAQSANIISLLGSELRLRTLAQSSADSQLFITSFPAFAVVSEPQIEFPDVASLFDPLVGVPPGFANSLVNVAINGGQDFLTINFANAGFGSFANGFQNTYVFTFDAPVV